ncbi:MAG: hypothetical protein N3F64_04380 [Nitrososphaeria archaeon]|nr:hypothetical protein [Nitrososphaeria archaeon]
MSEGLTWFRWEELADKAYKIVESAENNNVILRNLGSLAYRIHCSKFGYIQDELGRKFSDIDFASYSKFRVNVRKLYANNGWIEDQYFTKIFGHKRLLYYYGSDKKVHSDIFFDRLEFNHVIEFEGRLEMDKPTIPLAELFLEKMQIVMLNEKDVIDTIMLLREHEVGEGDNEQINAPYIAKILAVDWGFWKTVTQNMEKVKSYTTNSTKLSEEDKKVIIERIEKLSKKIDNEEKSLSWKLRARVGEKKKWYKDVEEVYR